MRPLFSAEMGYKNIYTWQVGDPTQFREVAPGEAPPQSDVWSCIRFKNPVNMPLTAAPVEMVQEGRIAGTNTLYYTPQGQECTVKMTRAVNVSTSTESRCTQQENVTSGGLIKGRRYTKYTNEVSLGLHNNTGEAISLEVTQSVRGQVLEVKEGGKVSTRANNQMGRQQLNLNNSIRWVIELPAGASKKLSYTYSYLD